LPREVDLTPHVRIVRDQQHTSSCVGQAFAGAIDICESSAGLYSQPASALFPYYHARREHQKIVLDGGTYIRAAARMMTKLGIPDAAHWPFSLLKVNRRPGWNAHRWAHPRRGGEYYALFGYGHERLSQVKAALANGHPVLFGAAVPRSFIPSRGPEIVDRPLDEEPIAGGHAMVLVGYREDADWGLLFRCLNSWGTDWRDGGYCWLTDAFVRWIKARDFTIVRGWDRLRNGRRTA
jgi:C1A family cysteine protease